MSIGKSPIGSGLLQRSTIILVVLMLLWAQLMEAPSGAQTHNRERFQVDEQRSAIEDQDTIDRAMTTICEERVKDPQGSIPIDEMAMQEPLPLNDRRVIAGRERAQRLLPVAKRLVPVVLNRLATAHNMKVVTPVWISSRLEIINNIKAEIKEHDNAAIRFSEPQSIIFGTVFLAGLRSDEAMLAVLAHELTHVADGQEHVLQPLFSRVGVRVLEVSRRMIQEDAAKELTCEMVGIQVVQQYLGKASGKGKIRRLVRPLEKNCVRRDLSDDTHLSPRETLRMLLMVEPDLMKAFTTTKKERRSKK